MTALIMKRFSLSFSGLALCILSLNLAAVHAADKSQITYADEGTALGAQALAQSIDIWAQSIASSPGIPASSHGAYELGRSIAIKKLLIKVASDLRLFLKKDLFISDEARVALNPTTMRLEAIANMSATQHTSDDLNKMLTAVANELRTRLSPERFKVKPTSLTAKLFGTKNSLTIADHKQRTAALVGMGQIATNAVLGLKLPNDKLTEANDVQEVSMFFSGFPKAAMPANSQTQDYDLFWRGVETVLNAYTISAQKIKFQLGAQLKENPDLARVFFQETQRMLDILAPIQDGREVPMSIQTELHFLTETSGHRLVVAKLLTIASSKALCEAILKGIGRIAIRKD